MRIEDRGQGFLRKNPSEDLEYRSFVPAPLCDLPEPILSSDGVKLLSSCSRKIGELEGMLRFVPNSSMYLSMYVRKEALHSAQIEGTQCTFDDISDPANAKLVTKDIADAVSHVRATDFAVCRMESLLLCARLLKETHVVLLDGTRRQEKNPGLRKQIIADQSAARRAAREMFLHGLQVTQERPSSIPPRSPWN